MAGAARRSLNRVMRKAPTKWLKAQPNLSLEL